MTTIPTMERGATAFLITGDASRNKVQTMPGGGFSTVSIDLPAAWDSLMTAKGYPALSDMYLTSTPGGDEDGIISIKSERSPKNAGRPVRSEYYNLQGKRNPYRRGVYIRRDVYNNGSSLSQKQIGH